LERRDAHGECRRRGAVYAAVDAQMRAGVAGWRMMGPWRS
jgi:hypothetical protein